MKKEKALTMVPIICDSCGKKFSSRLTYYPEKTLKTKAICKDCYKPDFRCHVEKCKGKPIVETKVPAIYGDYKEVHYYCKKHNYLAEVNEWLTKFINSPECDALVKEAVAFANWVADSS